MELQALEKQKFQSKSKSSKFTIVIFPNHNFFCNIGKTSSKKSKKSSSDSGKNTDIENTKNKSMITETHVNEFHNL